MNGTILKGTNETPEPHNKNSMKYHLTAMLFILFVGQTNGQSPIERTDTIIRISRQQIVTANQTKVFADSCKIQKERAIRTVDKCVELVVKKDGEISALRNALRESETTTSTLKEDLKGEQKKTRNERLKKKVNGAIMYAETIIIIGMAVFILVQH